MHRSRVTIGSALIAGALALVLSACGSSNGTGPTSALPPDSVQQQVAQTIAVSIQGQVGLFTQLGAGAFITPFIASLDVAPSGGLTGLDHRTTRSDGYVGRPVANFGPNCPTVTPPSATDQDHDNVPDSVTFTYTSGNCTDTNDGATVTGTIAITDPTATTADLDFDAVVNGIVVTIAGQGINARVGAGGSITVGETPGVVTEQVNDSLSIVETAPNSVNDSLLTNIAATFNFQGSTLLVDGDPTPPGTPQLSGSEKFTQGSTSYSFTVATPTPLTVDPTCESSITAGVLTITFGGDANAVATITWSGCGAYAVVHS